MLSIQWLWIIPFLSVLCYPKGITENEHQCLQKKNADACLNAGSQALNKGDKQKAEKFYRQGCDLESQSSCDSLAMVLGSTGRENEALELATKSCEEKGNFFSCENAGYYSRKMGNNQDSKKFYQKVCSSKESPIGCRELAELSKDLKERTGFQVACKTESWACLVLGWAELMYGDEMKGRTALVEGCKKDQNNYWLCDAAIKAIKGPKDVEDYVNMELECAHWGGEEPYDQERSEHIAKEVARSCKNRNTLAEHLAKKYAKEPEILFKVQQASRINQ